MYSPYYPPHDGRVARIKERCVDNAVGLDGQQSVAEVQSKVDVLSDPPVTVTDATVHCAGRILVKSRETDRKNGYENRTPFFSY